MSLANFIQNRLLQYIYVKQVVPSSLLGSYTIGIAVTAGGTSSTYTLSAFSINQDGTITLYLSRTYGASGVTGTDITLKSPTSAVLFTIPTLSGFTHPSTMAIVIKPGGVYLM